jgi:hypothetical protein
MLEVKRQCCVFWKLKKFREVETPDVRMGLGRKWAGKQIKIKIKACA